MGTTFDPQSAPNTDPSARHSSLCRLAGTAWICDQDHRRTRLPKHPSERRTENQEGHAKSLRATSPTIRYCRHSSGAQALSSA